MQLTNILTHLCNEGRQEILRILPANSCLSSSRLAMEVIKSFGYDAYEVPVHLVTSNDDGITIVGRYQGAETKGWNGHMVVVAKDPPLTKETSPGIWMGSTGMDYLLDISLDQIGQPPAFFEFPAGWPLAASFGPGGIRPPLVYFFDSSPIEYHNLDAWTELWKQFYEPIRNMIALNGE